MLSTAVNYNNQDHGYIIDIPSISKSVNYHKLYTTPIDYKPTNFVNLKSDTPEYYAEMQNYTGSMIEEVNNVDMLSVIYNSNLATQHGVKVIKKDNVVIKYKKTSPSTYPVLLQEFMSEIIGLTLDNYNYLYCTELKRHIYNGDSKPVYEPSKYTKNPTIYSDTEFHYLKREVENYIKDVVYNVDINHEFIVCDILNKFKEELPTFTYSYGYLNRPWKNNIEIERLKDIMKTDDTNVYDIDLKAHISEYADGMNMSEFVKYAKVDELIAIYTILLYSLKSAYDKCLFVHNNITMDNIIIVKTNPSIITLKDINDNEIRVKTSLIPVIIDYSKAVITDRARTYYPGTYYNVDCKAVHIRDILGVLSHGNKVSKYFLSLLNPKTVTNIYNNKHVTNDIVEKFYKKLNVYCVNNVHTDEKIITNEYVLNTIDNRHLIECKTFFHEEKPMYDKFRTFKLSQKPDKNERYFSMVRMYRTKKEVLAKKVDSVPNAAFDDAYIVGDNIHIHVNNITPVTSFIDHYDIVKMLKTILSDITEYEMSTYILYHAQNIIFDTEMANKQLTRQEYRFKIVKLAAAYFKKYNVSISNDTLLSKAELPTYLKDELEQYSKFMKLEDSLRSLYYRQVNQDILMKDMIKYRNVFVKLAKEISVMKLYNIIDLVGNLYYEINNIELPKVIRKL